MEKVNYLTRGGGTQYLGKVDAVTQLEPAALDAPADLGESPLGGVFLIGRSSTGVRGLKSPASVAHQVGEKVLPELAHRIVSPWGLALFQYADAFRDRAGLTHVSAPFHVRHRVGWGLVDVPIEFFVGRLCPRTQLRGPNS